MSNPSRTKGWNRSPFRARKETVSVAVVVFLCAMGGCGEKAIVPTSYEAYNCKDGNFKISYPAGWQVQSSGKGRYASARFTSGKALISVKTSLAGSLFGSMAETGVLKVTHPNQPVRRSPVTSVHLMEKESFQENEGVEEEDPMKIQTGLGEGQKSEFHGSNAFGAETHGYRVTTLSRDYRIRVVCKCPASEWESLQPAFDKVIESVGFGRAE